MTSFKGKLLLLVFSTLMVTVTTAADERRTDPDKLVSYIMPLEWNNTHFANGRHFQRADNPANKAILAVVPEVRDEYMTLEQTRSGRSRVHEIQGRKQVYSAVKQINEFEVWEAIWEANIRGDDVIMHDFMMFSDTRLVEVHLIASTVDYPEFLPDLRKVVASMRVN
ncbi:MAG: hypothetical protein ACFHXK_22005 [bacterium]